MLLSGWQESVDDEVTCNHAIIWLHCNHSGLSKMALTNAAKQAAYRARQKEVGSERLQLVVNLHAKLDFQRLSRHYGLTQSALLERLLAEEVNRVTKELDGEAFKQFVGETVTR
jgi:hypothetical protein